eukprot:gene16327-biopygen14323
MNARPCYWRREGLVQRALGLPIPLLLPGGRLAGTNKWCPRASPSVPAAPALRPAPIPWRRRGTATCYKKMAAPPNRLHFVLLRWTGQNPSFLVTSYCTARACCRSLEAAAAARDPPEFPESPGTRSRRDLYTRG